MMKVPTRAKKQQSRGIAYVLELDLDYMVNERRGVHNPGGGALIVVAAGPKRPGKPGLFALDHGRGDDSTV